VNSLGEVEFWRRRIHVFRRRHARAAGTTAVNGSRDLSAVADLPLPTQSASDRDARPLPPASHESGPQSLKAGRARTSKRKSGSVRKLDEPDIRAVRVEVQAAAQVGVRAGVQVGGQIESGRSRVPISEPLSDQLKRDAAHLILLVRDHMFDRILNRHLRPTPTVSKYLLAGSFVLFLVGSLLGGMVMLIAAAYWREREDG
jgi:hypothetical protein